MNYTPFFKMMSEGGLPFADGTPMTIEHINDRLQLLRQFFDNATDRENRVLIQHEIRVLEMVLGQRRPDQRTCGELGMDVEWAIFGTHREE